MLRRTKNLARYGIYMIHVFRWEAKCNIFESLVSTTYTFVSCFIIAGRVFNCGSSFGDGERYPQTLSQIYGRSIEVGFEITLLKMRFNIAFPEKACKCLFESNQYSLLILITRRNVSIVTK